MNIFLLAALFLSTVPNLFPKSTVNGWEPPSYLFHIAKKGEDSEITETVEEVDQVALSGGARMSRVRHYLDGFPVWNDGATVVHLNGTARVVSSKKMDTRAKHKLARTNRKGKLRREMRSRKTCREHWNLMGMKLKSASFQRYIYDPEPDNPAGPAAVYADLVGFDGVTGNEMISKVCLINTDDNSVILAWDGVHKSWDGGNLNTGQYTYGKTLGKPTLFDYTEKSWDGTCKLVNTDRKIYVYDLEHSNYYDIPDLSPYKFSCGIGPTDGEPRGYGALADAFYNAIVSYDMLTDSDWGGLSQITNEPAIQIGVHYRESYDNAIYNRKHFYFGDGDVEMYPSATCLDIMAHELAHGVTHANSDLIYSGEAGCLNEAFSDVAGAMVKNYATGAKDWCVGSDCMLSDQCMRTMDRPSKYSDYFPNCAEDGDCQEVHSCSAVPNYIFYTLATTSGWDIQSAGRAFILANRFVWNQQTDIKQAGCDVATVVVQANIAQGDTAAVALAWAAAGIDLSHCISSSGGLDSGSASNPIALTNCNTLSNTEATKTHLYYKVTAPAGSTEGHISIQGSSGDADLHVKKGSPPTTMDFDERPYLPGSNENVNLQGIWLSVPSDYYILVHSGQYYSGLSITACFQ